MPSILITGANRGLGLEMTKQYLQEGWQVIACCRSPSKASALIDLETKSKGQLRLLELDVNDASTIASLPSLIQNQPIDILINNAGILRTLNRENLNHISPEEWLESFRVNTIAPALIAKSLSGPIAAGQQKIIVNLSSHLGSISLVSDPIYLLYGSSKAALNYVTKSLAIELRTSGIIVISIHPGWVKTDMGGEKAQLMPAESVAGIKKLLKNLTLKQSGSFYDYSGKIIPY